MAMGVEQETAKQTDRILRFIEASRVRGDSHPENRYWEDLTDAYDRYADLPQRERQARARAEALERLPVALFPGERLVGMAYPRVTPSDSVVDYGGPARVRSREDLPENRELVEFEVFSDGAAPGHITCDWQRIMHRGVTGLLNDYRDALRSPRDETAREFYEGVILSLEALLRWNERHVDALREALPAADGAESERLRKMIDLCERVPAHPARGFHEAVQSFYFPYLAVLAEAPYGGNGPGRLDYHLWPYLRADLEAGAITYDAARELIDELFIRIHERIQPWDGWVEAIVVGGTHRDGSCAVNPLSTMMVESIMDLDITHPSVYMRMPADPPEEWVSLAARYLVAGQNRAQILNDPPIMAGFVNAGVSEEDSAMFACGGCMEPSPQGMNSDLLFTGTQNIAKILELVLTGGKCLQTGKRLADVDLPPLAAYKTFEDLYSAFDAEVRRALDVYFRRLDFVSEVMAERRPLYLTSSMVDDCLERGRELHDGGARYHHYGAAPLSIQGAGDALSAVKRAVFEDRICTAEELVQALDADFEGHEDLRQRLRNLPKFGQLDDEADAMVERVLGTVCDTYDAHRNRHDGRCKPMLFTFTWAPSAGASLGATADGVHAGHPIPHGLTPQTCGMSEGIMAAIASHTALPLSNATGATTSMWDLAPEFATEETVEGLLAGFLELGGEIFQGNTTDVGELTRAQGDPESYPNLMVRVGGYSARFVLLPRELQDDIIHRHRHSG